MSELARVGWTWYPSVVIGLSLWTLLYGVAATKSKPIPPAQQMTFHVGTLIALIALVSPLDKLGDDYLFSAHMVQHLLLMFLTAPLWLAGTPGWLIDSLVPQPLTRFIQQSTRPLPAYVAFVGVMWIWHIPSLYEMAQAREALHILEHLTYIGAALIGWWPVMAPPSSRLYRPAAPVQMLYLFLLALPCTALAAILTFAHAPLYAYYVSVRHPFGLDALQDQRLGGLLMWLPTHGVLLVALGLTFLRWFAESSRESQHTLART